MALSIFSDKTKQPDEGDLSLALGDTFIFWNEIKSFVHQQYPAAAEEWKFPGSAYGWSFRLRDKKRVIVYLTPNDGYFTLAMVLGKDAADDALKSSIPAAMKAIIESAPVYAEGRGFRFEVRSKTMTVHVKKIISLKIAH